MEEEREWRRRYRLTNKREGCHLCVIAVLEHSTVARCPLKLATGRDSSSCAVRENI